MGSDLVAIMYLLNLVVTLMYILFGRQKNSNKIALSIFVGFLLLFGELLWGWNIYNEDVLDSTMIMITLLCMCSTVLLLVLLFT